MRLAYADRPYRKCVGIMLFNGRGEVFAGRRIDQVAEAWQMPQGGIDDGETARQAALRELAEETGTRAAEIVAESAHWRSYDLPRAIANRVMCGRYRGQTMRWFAMRFTGNDADFRVGDVAEPEFDAWRWCRPDELVALMVPFKRQIYSEVFAEFGDLLV